MSKKIKKSGSKSSSVALFQAQSKASLVILTLTFILCLVTLYVVITLQGQLEQQALQQRIEILNSIKK